MRNEDKINELKALGKTPTLSDVFDTLEKIGDLKVNYDEILRDATAKWKVGGPSVFDIAISEYLETGNYDEVAAVLTFLTREDKGEPGAFKRRSKNGEIKKVIDRMIQLLQSDDNAAAEEWITVKGQICPVCGKYTFIEDDNFEICPVCGWEDDGLQREDPDYDGGANHLSLNQYREQYRSRMKTQSEEGEGIINDGQICPVCGKHTFEEDGNYEICPECGWEDDAIQRNDPDYDGGANDLSLNQYREEYRKRMETHTGKREWAMIQLEKMVKDPPTDDSAYYDIAETLGAFEESYNYFKDKDTKDISGILENVENATREEALVAFGTLVAWEHLNEGLIQNVKEQGFLSKLLKRIIETHENADPNERTQYELDVTYSECEELSVKEEPFNIQHFTQTAGCNKGEITTKEGLEARKRINELIKSRKETLAEEEFRAATDADEENDEEIDPEMDDFDYFLEPGESYEGEEDPDVDDFEYFQEPKKTEESDAEDTLDDDDFDDFEYFLEPGESYEDEPDTDDLDYFLKPEEGKQDIADKEFSDFVMETLGEDLKDPEIVDIIKGEIKRSEEELKHSKQMRDLLKDYEAHEEEIGFDLNAVKKTLDPAVIHTAVLRVMTEQGVPGWAKRFYIKGKLMEEVRMTRSFST